jgi:DNA-binding MarR family transcriptional regulator
MKASNCQKYSPQQAIQDLLNNKGEVKQHYRILLYIIARARLTCGQVPNTGEVAAVFHISKQMVNGHYNRLRKKGYLDRIEDNWVITGCDWQPPDYVDNLPEIH